MRSPASFATFVLIALSAIAGCSSQSGDVMSSDADAGDGAAVSTSSNGAVMPTTSWTRDVAPFDVRDGNGDAYRFPFLGGINVPRTQLVDIDADGDADLFLQEYTGKLMFFENTGSAAAHEYTFRSDAYSDLDIGEWYRFVDLDQDGDFDILAEKRFSHVRYFKNTGTPSAPEFDGTLYALKDTDGEELFSDRQNIPNVTDIDGDGKLDLFVGRVDGTIYRYEAVDEDSQGMPRFVLVSTRFEEIEIIGEIQVGASLHGANTMAYADYDGDGDDDLFWGDFFESGLLLIENSGSANAPALQNEPVRFPRNEPLRTSGYNAPAFGDLNGDGRPDALVGVLGGAFNPSTTASDNLYYLQHAGERDFEVVTTRFLSGIDVGTESIPALADIDADGDLDLFISNKIDPVDGRRSLIYYYENQGTRTAPSFQLTDTLAFAESYHAAPAFGDIDADGDLDIVMGSWTKGMMLIRNEGTPASPNFVLENDDYLQLTRGSNSTPVLVDIDDDGDLDLFAGESSGDLNFYENVGSPSDPSFSFVSDSYADVDAGRRSFVEFADVDGDGDQDMIVGRDKGAPMLLRNDGDRSTPRFVDGGLLPFETPEFATPRLADLNGDGRLDIVVGVTGGGLYFYMGS